MEVILWMVVSLLTAFSANAAVSDLFERLEAKGREIRVREFLETGQKSVRIPSAALRIHERWGRFWQGNFERILSHEFFQTYERYLESWIDRSDHRNRMTPGYLAGCQGSAAFFGVSVFGLLSESLWLGTLAFFLGGALPLIWIRDEALRRERKLLSELPTALDRFSLCVEAGLTLDQAMAHYLSAARLGPLKEELAGLMGQVRTGSSRRVALMGLSDRLGLMDFTLFTTGVIHAERSGTGLSPTLRRLATTLRDKQSQRAEKAVQELPVKMLLPLLFCIMPVTLLVVFAPILLRLLSE